MYVYTAFRVCTETVLVQYRYVCYWLQWLPNIGNGAVVTATLLVFAVMLPDCGPRQLSRYSDSLLAALSGDRIPVAARFSALAQTGPGAHRTPYTMGSWSFTGLKRSGRDVDYPPPSSAEVQERVELYIYSPSGPSWPVLG
jgi:hypothetical protein